MMKEHLEEKSSIYFRKLRAQSTLYKGGGSTIANTEDKYFEQKTLHTEEFFKSRIHVRFKRILHKKQVFKIFRKNRGCKPENYNPEF